MALWDGRFDGSPAEEMQRFGESLSVDLQMWREDIMGSKAHATMLQTVGLLTEDELNQILRGLDQVAQSTGVAGHRISSTKTFTWPLSAYMRLSGPLQASCIPHGLE